MQNINGTIATNISKNMEKKGLNTPGAARLAGIGEKRFRDVANGKDWASAAEMDAIAAALGVDTGALFEPVESPLERMEKEAKTEEAKKAIQTAGELADLILFHARVRGNGEKMMEPAEI